MFSLRASAHTTPAPQGNNGITPTSIDIEPSMRVVCGWGSYLCRGCGSAANSTMPADLQSEKNLHSGLISSKGIGSRYKQHMRHQGGIFSKIELVKNFDQFDKQKHSSQSRTHAMRPYISPYIYIINFRMEIFTLTPLLRIACGKATFLCNFLLWQ